MRNYLLPIIDDYVKCMSYSTFSLTNTKSTSKLDTHPLKNKLICRDQLPRHVHRSETKLSKVVAGLNSKDYPYFSL